MSSQDQKTVFVRIIELPPVKMARSGSGDLWAFNKWWTAIAAKDKSSLFPKDFMWWNPKLNKDEWLYAFPEGLEDTGGNEVFDFPGGLFAVASCKDNDADIEGTFKLIHQWVVESGIFELSLPEKEANPRYDMAHVITPQNAKETLGYHQLDLFVPIVEKKR